MCLRRSRRHGAVRDEYAAEVPVVLSAGAEELMPHVRFVPLGKDVEVRNGGTILAAANRCQAPVGQSCSGEGVCGLCKVTVLEGIEHLAPPADREKRLMQEKEFQPDERAACLARIQGDITVTTTYWGHE
jgi:ferredoxin, 2Fe-2S